MPAPATPTARAVPTVPADTPEVPGGAGGRPLETLLRVQELDTALSQLWHRKATLPDRIELGGVERELAGLTARAEGPRAAKDALVARLSDLQSQDDALGARLAGLEARLYESRGASARDLQAMDEEARHLRQRRSELEDAEIEAMVEQEPLDAELAGIEAEEARLRDAASRLRESVAAAETVIDAEAATVKAERDALAATLPGELAERYEALRARLGGTGAAPLVGNRCEGCHLELPAAEVDRIRRLPDDVLVTCEQCGRILVRPGAPRTPG